MAKQRKGDPTDPIIIMIILFWLAVSFIVVLFLNSKISTVISTTALNSTTAFESINQAFNHINTVTVQNGFVIMFGIICIFMIGSAFLVRVHPVFLFLYVFMLAFSIIGAVFIGNAYDSLRNSEQLKVIMDANPKINFVLDNIVIIITAIGFASMLIIFSKIFGPPDGGGGGI